MISVGHKLTVVLIWGAVICVCCSSVSAKKESANNSSSSSDSSARSMFSLACLEPMQVVDWLRSGALVLGFLAILFCDKRPQTWFQAELFFVGSSALMGYFAPAAFLDFQTDGPTNAVHEMSVQSLGAIVMGVCFTQYAMTNDAAVHNLHNVLRTIGTSVLFMTHAYGHSKYKADPLHFTLQHCSFTLLAVGLAVVGYAIQLYRSNQASSSRPVAANIVSNAGLNRHLLLDGFLLLLFGFLDFGFPDFGLSFIAIPGFKPDGILATLSRHGGVLEIMCGLQSIFYCGLQNDADKRAQLRGRLVMYIALYPLLFLYQWKHALMAWRDFAITLAVSLVFVGNAICALYIKQKRH